MNDPRPILIILRLSLGLIFLGSAAALALAFLGLKDDVGRTGAALSGIATYCCGIYFCQAGLDIDLWKPLWPQDRYCDPDAPERAIADERAP